MSTDEPTYKLECLFGYCEIKPVQYRIVGGEVATRWWQRRREEYWIVTQFSQIGPFASRNEASMTLALGGEREARP